MGKETRRGFMPSDERDFGGRNPLLLREAQRDIVYLLDRGYSPAGALTLVGNHYSLSARQRLALQRSASSGADLVRRREKESGGIEGETVHIDAFNIIISLEIALSGSLLLLCMDGTIRDLAGLHGSYRIIDKTVPAIRLILETLTERSAARAVFYIDAPISNSGNLGKCIRDTAESFTLITECSIIDSPDRALYGKRCVASSDSIVLNRCESWINLAKIIVDERFPDYPLLRLT